MYYDITWMACCGNESCGMSTRVRHRTGHSLGREVHGAGANVDNFETHDERPVIPRTCFSIEPALYPSDFGVRPEIRLFVEQQGARVTDETQQEFVLPGFSPSVPLAKKTQRSTLP